MGQSQINSSQRNSYSNNYKLKEQDLLGIEKDTTSQLSLTF